MCFFLLRARREISQTGEWIRQRGGFNFGDCELRASSSELFYPLRNQLVQHLCLPVWESGFWTGGEKEINNFLGESVMLLLPAELLLTDLECVPLVPLQWLLEQCPAEAEELEMFSPSHSQADKAASQPFTARGLRKK